MVDSSDFPKDILRSPSKIALAMTNALEATLDDGSTIPNAMNGLTISWASAAGVFSSIVNMLDNDYSTLYPKRALLPEHLYPHLSQYDYIQLQSTPASLTMAFAIRKDELIAGAEPYDDVYNAIIIPRTMALSIGPIQVSMFYDIIIRVNKVTNVISVLYDTTEDSPFMTLDSNMMAYPPVEMRQNFLDFIQFGFNVYQFTRTPYLKTLSSQEGFCYNFPYSDNFYAVRVFSVGVDGTLTELTQCYDSRYYDTTTPTAVISLDNVNNKVRVVIPQIYLENNQVSSQIKVEVYSTLGAVNYNIPLGDAGNVKANFDPKSSTYAAPLEKLSSWRLYPMQQTLVGGSSPKTFDQMKDGVVNQTFYTRIPITQAELNALAKNSGYSLTESIDDITNRTYFATRALYDSDNTLLPVLVGSIVLQDDSLEGNPSTILIHRDQSLMILPTTVFALGATGSTCTPVKDETLNYLASLEKDLLIQEMNNTTYLRQPFHIALTTDKVYPIARPYNLLSPSATQLTYLKENETSDEQMSVTAVNVVHLADGTGGYAIKFSTTLTDSLKSVDPSTLQICMTLPTTTNTRVYLTGNVTETTTAGNVIFTIKLPTNYHIDVSDNITLTMLDWNGAETAALVGLSSTANILLMVPKNNITSEDQDNEILPNIPSPIRTMLCVAMQSMTLTLGVNMDKLIYSAVNTTWGNDVYKTYLENVYQTADSVVYQRNKSNQLVTRIITNTSGVKSLDYVTLYKEGDPLVSENDISTTVSGTIDQGISVLNVTNPAGILVGMMATASGIPYGITVKDITGNTVTLSGKVTGTVLDGSAIIFSNKTLILSLPSDQGNDLTRLPVGQTGGIYVGQSVYGFDIPAGTTVASIQDTQTIVLSHAATTTIKSGTIITFINKTAPGIAIHKQGDNVVDNLGQPILIKDRQNIYSIPAILFDGRLYESANVSDQQLVAELPHRLNDYAAGISAINMDFAEQRDVFYRPSRTIGTASFNTGNGVTAHISLSVGLNVTFYLPESLYANDTIRNALKTTTLTQFSSILGNKIISTFDLGKNLKAVLGDNITGVVVSGLNGDENLMVTSLEDTSCNVSVRKILYIRDDGVIDRKPDINFTFLSSTDGS